MRQATLRNREKRVTQEPMDYTKYQLHILARRFRLGSPPNRTGRTGSKNDENARNQVSDLHLDKFPDSCSNSGGGSKKERWNKSTDDLMTSQSVEGRDFPDLEMIDAKMASAKKRIKLISTSEEELMSRNRKLKNTTEFLKEGRLPV